MTIRNRTNTHNENAMPARRIGAVRQESRPNEEPRFTQVHLRIHQIECVKTSKEIGQDETTLAAIKVEGELKSSGGKKKLAAKAENDMVLDAGKFKKCNARQYDPPEPWPPTPRVGQIRPGLVAITPLC